MKRLLFIALLFWSAGIASATAYNTHATGNWNVAGTWTTGACGTTTAPAVPVAGDTITICSGHVITVSDAETVGASGITGTFAINMTAASTSKLLITSTGSLNVRGGCNCYLGTIEVDGDGAWNWDPPAAAQYSLDTSAAGLPNFTFKLLGSAGHQVIVTTTARGGSNGFFNMGGAGSKAATVDIEFASISNCGDSSNSCIGENNCNVAGTNCASIIVKNTVCKSCGEIQLDANDGNVTLDVEQLSIQPSIPTNNISLQITNTTALASGTRTFKNVTIYNGTGTMSQAKINVTSLTEGVANGNFCTTPALIGYNVSVVSTTVTNNTDACSAFLVDVGYAGSSYNLQPNGATTIKNCLVYAHASNFHFAEDGGADAAVGANTLTHCVGDGDLFFSGDSGDWYVSQLGATTVSYNVLINSIGTLMTGLATGISMTANHNTNFQQVGFSYDEGNANASGLVSLQSNLWVLPATNQPSNVKADGIHAGSNSVFARQSAATIDYNGVCGMLGSGDTCGGTVAGAAVKPVNLTHSTGGYVSYPAYPQQIVTGGTACTASVVSTVNITTSTAGCFTNAQTGDYIFKTNNSGSGQNNYARIVTVTDSTHIILEAALTTFIATDTFQVTAGYLSAGTEYGASGFGSHDVHADPKFKNQSATMKTWAASIGITQTVQGVAQAMVTINGWASDGTATAATSTATVDAALRYFADPSTGAFVPTNSAFNNTAHDGTFIGALAPLAGCGMTILLGGVGCP